jgi:hypothetical protein
MIKFAFRWAFRFLILLLVLVVAGILLLDTIAKAVIEHRIRRATGLDAKIGKLEIGIFNSKVTLENFVVYNSAEFGGSPLVQMPELHVEYDRGALFSRKLHYKLVRFNLAQLNIVENKNGRLNTEMLQKNLPGTAGSKPGGPHIGYQFTGIDTLNLTLGKVTFVSMKQGGVPEELKMDMQNVLIPNVKSGQDLSAVMIVIALKNGVNIMGNGGNTTGLQGWLQKLAQPAPK